MPATFVNFTPSTESLFSFQAQLAGSLYTVSTPWNVFGQRYYVSVADANGNVILNQPLIACGPQIPAALTWSMGVATAATQTSHNVPLGQVANVVISQTDSGFDGSYQALATGPFTLTYLLGTNPQEATPINGQVNFNSNMVGSVIPGAYLLYRFGTSQFEFGP